MKRFFISICLLLAAVAAPAAEMGRFDPLAQSWTVNTDFWQCTFVEGSMTPGCFRFRDNRSAGAIVFQDALRGETKNKFFYLSQERWAESTVLRNDADAFVIELRGGFWNNQSTTITPFPEVSATYRYEFRRDSHVIRIHCRLRKPRGKAVFIYCSGCPGWLYEHSFRRITATGKTESFDLGGKTDRWATRTWDARGSITLEAPEFLVTVTAPRVIAGIRPDYCYPVFLNFGAWRHAWEPSSTELEFAGTLDLQVVRK